MSRYHFLKQNRDLLLALKKVGLIDATVFLHLKVFEAFNKKKGTVMERYTQVGMDYQLSSRHVKRIVLNLKKELR